ncbi:hypothetical protein BCR42DRAFT_150324 [Absidia repens]|uniref:Uncharacterized protein n=1 Tax=Absidia repens TaxID=90262 RepID=A0A1X2I245_9FUNG|nr:hypothetical protein BCR42DRAFT_150324 [Absidia repens]
MLLTRLTRHLWLKLKRFGGMVDKGAIVEMTGLELLAQEHGIPATVYKEAQQVISNFISNHLPQQTTLVVTPVEKINTVNDF